MAHTTLRKLHISGETWHYCVRRGMVRIFRPDTKICWREVGPNDLPYVDSQGVNAGIRPAEVKAWVENHLISVKD